jgi:hypothetical protein
MNSTNPASRIHLHRNYSRGLDAIELFWTKCTGSGFKQQFVTAELTLHDEPPYHKTDPGIVFNEDECQQLADELWEKGFRPRAAAGSNGQLEAVNNHLQDMRAMVAKACDVNLPTRPA